jgi:hypothetical protein
MGKGTQALLSDLPDEAVVRVLHFCTYKAILRFASVGSFDRGNRFAHVIVRLDLQEVFSYNTKLD